MSRDGLLDFADRMIEVMSVMMKEFTRRQAHELFELKITIPQILILNFLNLQGESKMTDIAKFMRVSTAAMTGIVDRLVRDQYVARVFDPRDRRIIRVKLTNRGTELLKKINQHRRKTVIKLFGKISQKEREEYLKVLLRIRDTLLQEKEV
jgi:DNA-binding MarR family transcriptional regulator